MAELRVGDRVIFWKEDEQLEGKIFQLKEDYLLVVVKGDEPGIESLMVYRVPRTTLRVEELEGV